MLIGYSITNQADVSAFLAARPHLRPLLDEAPRRIEHTFGKKLPLRLKVFRDHEDPSAAELVFEIVTGKSGADAWSEADALLRKLHEQWLVFVPRGLMQELLFVN